MYNYQIKTYFDSLAATYAKRLGSDSPFLSYYFSQRLEVACEGMNLNGKHMLDVGAGTGALYDFLAQKGIDTRNYCALDISHKMLQESSIPENQQRNEDIYTLDVRPNSLDYIFVLGVSTYMSIAEIHRLISIAQSSLKFGGQLIISFTYRSGLDCQMRQILRPMLHRISPGLGVIQQPFPIMALTPKNVQALGTSQLQITALKWLPLVLPGLHHLFPKWAVKASKYLNRLSSKSDSLKFLRTDFVTFWVKAKPDV